MKESITNRQIAYIARNHEIMGHIAGLLEAWLDYTTSADWEPRLLEIASDPVSHPADRNKVDRVLRLIALLDPEYIIETIDPDNWDDCNRSLLVALARVSAARRAL
jgi:hypothetical protein